MTVPPELERDASKRHLLPDHRHRHGRSNVHIDPRGSRSRGRHRWSVGIVGGCFDGDRFHRLVLGSVLGPNGLLIGNGFHRERLLGPRGCGKHQRFGSPHHERFIRFSDQIVPSQTERLLTGGASPNQRHIQPPSEMIESPTTKGAPTELPQVEQPRLWQKLGRPHPTRLVVTTTARAIRKV